MSSSSAPPTSDVNREQIGPHRQPQQGHPQYPGNNNHARELLRSIKGPSPTTKNVPTKSHPYHAPAVVPFRILWSPPTPPFVHTLNEPRTRSNDPDQLELTCCQRDPGDRVIFRQFICSFTPYGAASIPSVRRSNQPPRFEARTNNNQTTPTLSIPPSS